MAREMEITGHLNKFNLQLQGMGQTALAQGIETGIFCYFKKPEGAVRTSNCQLQ
ncbi:Hypothetical predicted protein [Scomber scombrus]|uniref:Uncharacterized protein n=1 Tax=Scomber scombrus TaxID=13677 RepID=A0AAV1MWU6_SCOSC